MAHGCVPPVQPVHNRPWECSPFITFLPVEDCHAPAMPFWEEARRSFRCLDDAGSFRGVECLDFVRNVNSSSGVQARFPPYLHRFIDFGMAFSPSEIDIEYQ